MRALCRSNKPRAEIDTSGAEYQRRRSATPIEDATCGHDRDWRDCVNNLRNESHRTDLATVPARLAPLCDYHIDAPLSCSDSLSDRRDLEHDARPAIVSLPYHVTRVVQCEGDYRRLCL